jgi:hypothetical protein
VATKTKRDRWPLHANDAATYRITPPDGYEEATDWRLQFRATPLPDSGLPSVALEPTPDESGLTDDPASVAFSFDENVVKSKHDGWRGDVQCSFGTLLTIELRVEDDWTE